MNRNSKVRRDNPFKTQRVFRPKFTITHRITTDLTRIERARGFLEAATLSEDWIRAMGERALVLEAHHTTHIEGTRLTLEQAERLWVGEKVPEADPDDVRELLNYRKAFDLVAEYLNSGSPITEGMIREIHKRLVEGVRGGQASPGEYRRKQNYVVNSVTGEIIYTPPPAQDVPPFMAEFVAWLNREKEIHPVLVAVSHSSNLCTSILFLMEMDEPPDYCPLFIYIGQDMTLKDCLPLVNIMTVIVRPFTVPFRACENKTWI